MRKFWSEKEVDILKKNYALSTKKEVMALLPNRSAVSIGHKASRLNLIKELSRWTEDELDILRVGYPCLNKEELLKSLPKKRWTSIRHKSEELGLKCNAEKFYKRNWKKFDMGSFSDFDKGYLAGFIDADGSITIKKAVDKRVNKTYYAPLVSFYNTDAKLMSKIRSIVKTGSFHKGKRRKPKHKPKFVYNVGSINGAKQILEQITPHLIVKRRRAELVLEFIKIKESSSSGMASPRILEIFEEVRELNLRGNNHPRK